MADTQKWKSGEENVPQITSSDPEERKLARRLRIIRKKEAAKKLQVVTDETKSLQEDERTLLENQVEKSTVELITLADEGTEMVTNVRVAVDAREVKRREQEALARQERIEKLEAEANIALEKFRHINAKWEKIASYKDPLDLHLETEAQKEKCMELIDSKNKIIEQLKEELKAADVRFVNDLKRQAEDISILVERIDNQVKIMRNAYRNELLLIEHAIDVERQELMNENNQDWETLYKLREKDEVDNINQRIAALNEHNDMMTKIMVDHQELFRATKIALAKDVQLLQQELEQLRATCLLNKEKMDYNYQVLKKRDEESLLIRSQQKRKINKLQDKATTIKHKINTLEQTTKAEAKRLTSEVVRLHNNIKDIEQKAEYFSRVNDTKYNQLWKFNYDSAKKLLDKVLSIDQIIYQQHLGLEWDPPEINLINKADLPSYKKAMKIIKESKETSDESKTSTVTRMMTHTCEHSQQVMHLILEAVSNSTGFLLEDKLEVLLQPYTKAEGTLVRIDNIFNALGVKREEDILLLKKMMKPYLICSTCFELDMAVSLKSSSQLHSVTEMKTESMMRCETKDSEISGFPQLSPVPSLSASSENNSMTLSYKRLRQSLGHIRPLSKNGISEETKSVTNDTVDEFIAVHEGEQQLSEEQVIVPSSEQETFTTNVHGITICTDPMHEHVIDPVYILAALRDFVREFQKNNSKEEENKTFDIKRHTISRLLDNKDVTMYWQKFRDVFTPDKEKLWDCLLLGFQKYHSILQERHKVNVEVERLKVQNADLRRLLQNYALPNNMRKGASKLAGRDFLPPLVKKTAISSTSSKATNKILLKFDMKQDKN